MSEKIRALTDRQQAREKISIFFGSADNYMHPIKEVIANSTDEIINNFDSGEIKVELSDDMQTVEIKDSGRGLPIGGETDGVKNYELLLLTLFAGTKYGEGGTMEGSYTGSNGVGLTTVNYTSSLFEVTSIYKGKEHHIKFESGGEITEKLSVKETDKPNGTTIKFRLDPEIYTKIEYSNEEMKDVVKRYAVSSSKITINYKHKDEIEKYHYDSLQEYYDDIAQNLSTSSIRYNESEVFDDGGEKTSLSLIFSTTTEVIQETYLNLNYLPNGGTINDGIINGVKLYMNKYCRNNNLFPKGIKSFSDVDIQESLSFVGVMLSNKVEFENQTKFSTQKKLYGAVAKKQVTHMLEVMEIEDKKGFDAMVKHFLLVQKDNTSNQRQKEKLRKKLAEKVDNMSNKIDKFVDCKIHGEEAELYLAEGDSAHGSVVLARDGKFQASLPMGGKFLNVEKASGLDVVSSNEIIMNVVKVLGCGIDLGKKHKDLPPFDIEKLRYGKVICASDEDPDGAQIQVLIITLFHKLMPEIIRQGKLFIAKTPLYEIKMKNDDINYAYTDAERDKLIKKLGSDIENISRSKGLGELSPEVMSETAMNPETRHLVQVTIDDAHSASQVIQDWMGSQVDNRKEFISNNLNRYLDVLVD